jgi:hypothetical protein
MYAGRSLLVCLKPLGTSALLTAAWILKCLCYPKYLQRANCMAPAGGHKSCLHSLSLSLSEPPGVSVAILGTAE